jgi:uncharacterized SAM-binding protein YcdF (DUF218 family)
MLNYLKSAVSFAAMPSNFLFLLVVFGLLALVVRYRRTAITMLSLAVLGFLAFGYSSISEVLIAPLVTRFPPVDLATAAPPDGIIVLGSGLNEVHAAYNGALIELNSDGEAIPVTALLAQRFPNARLILSGGAPGPFPAVPMRDVDGMQRVLTEYGIARDRSMIDPNSRSTFDRIVNTLALVGEDRDKRWWVMTSAHRMPRVIGTYRQAGFEPIAYPIDFKWVPPFDPSYTYPLTGGLSLTDDAVHEWLALISYALSDKSASIFPAPPP